MPSRRGIAFPLIVSAILFLACQTLRGQTLIDTVLVGYGPEAVAVDPMTNMVYVLNGYDQTVSVMNAADDTVVATVTVGNNPYGLVVNPFTNRIYVVNEDGTVTMIDGNTNTPSTIQVGNYPWDIAINTVTNKIYVTNYGDGTVSVIDGATNLVTATIPVRTGPGALAINTTTNMIYVCNWGENTVSVINGATNADVGPILVGTTPSFVTVNTVTNMVYVASYTDTTVSVINGANNHVVATLQLTDRPEDIAINPVTALVYVPTADGNVTIVNSSNQIAGVLPLPDGEASCANYPGQLCTVVDPVTNKIYIPDGNNQLQMIDGNTNNVNSITVGNSDIASDINLGTNRLYVANYGDNTISVVQGAKASPLQWYSVTPCRVWDTRQNGGSPQQAGTTQHMFIPQLPCNTPATAAAYSLNVTVVPRGSLGYLTIWPTGEPQPLVSTMNSYDGRVKANAAIVPSGASGGVDVYVTNTTDVIVDIDGYFAPVSSNSYEFYALTPCRVVDTRQSPNGPLAGPRMEAGQIRDFPVLSSSCLTGISNPQAYSFNVTVVPNPAGQPLNYLTIWPSDQTQPVVSTLNNPTATVVANAALVPASQVNGDIKIYTYNSTDVIVDINGYYGVPGTGGLSMYPLAPCRVLDTRQNHGQPFQGTLNPPINVAGGVCAPDPNSQAYIFNATVVPQGVMGYLTLWPVGEQQMPVVSTLNAYDGWVTSNMAIVPNLNGSINAYAAGLTHLIMDISGYFAPQSSDDGQSKTTSKSPHRSEHPREKKVLAAPHEGWPMK